MGVRSAHCSLQTCSGFTLIRTSMDCELDLYDLGTLTSLVEWDSRSDCARTSVLFRPLVLLSSMVSSTKASRQIPGSDDRPPPYVLARRGPAVDRRSEILDQLFRQPCRVVAGKTSRLQHGAHVSISSITRLLESLRITVLPRFAVTYTQDRNPEGLIIILTACSVISLLIVSPVWLYKKVRVDVSEAPKGLSLSH
ncbi:hypothetical protein PHLGIDRAFT_400048 [Phlebiopsis gigantea 11061_1 CR5-6]|uniref:Uncharacterized protein n=1 Tax=Phlebiopsis gigantea (strain 11061_1 CR5-6) TaxID=745531 RepID=A0A0C3S6U9_PHLG1|nr:hypothetical protein PHLGIDRAFT_400048 [Phlebiopsis gigantea 11061_1 CR5-6]